MERYLISFEPEGVTSFSCTIKELRDKSYYIYREMMRYKLKMEADSVSCFEFIVIKTETFFINCPISNTLVICGNIIFPN